jgi:hypothetical protein
MDARSVGAVFSIGCAGADGRPSWPVKLSDAHPPGDAGTPWRTRRDECGGASGGYLGWFLGKLLLGAVVPLYSCGPTARCFRTTSARDTKAVTIGQSALAVFAGPNGNGRWQDSAMLLPPIKIKDHITYRHEHSQFNEDENNPPHATDRAPVAVSPVDSETSLQNL